MAKKWIAAMHLKKGALHEQMGIAQNKKIPSSKLAVAAKKGGTLGRRATVAQTLKKFH